MNPKILIFFLAFFPGFLWDKTENIILQFYVLGIVFMLTSFTVFSFLAFLAGYISSSWAKKPTSFKLFKMASNYCIYWNSYFYFNSLIISFS
jgi:threonine/homoserine/homoserine lactone efflux protein